MAKHRAAKSSSKKKEKKAEPPKVEVQPPPAVPQNTETKRELTPRERSNLNLAPPFPKGVSGNPGGRPKKVLEPLLLAFLEQIDPKDKKKRIRAQIFIEEFYKRALKKSDQLAKELFARIDGVLTPDTEAEVTAQAGVKVIILDAPRPRRPTIPALPANQAAKGD